MFEGLDSGGKIRVTEFKKRIKIIMAAKHAELKEKLPRNHAKPYVLLILFFPFLASKSSHFSIS